MYMYSYNNAAAVATDNEATATAAAEAEAAAAAAIEVAIAAGDGRETMLLSEVLTNEFTDTPIAHSLPAGHSLRIHHVSQLPLLPLLGPFPTSSTHYRSIDHDKDNASVVAP